MDEEIKYIRLSQINKTYVVEGKEICALDSVDMEFYQGRLYTIEGPSGSGKSTLLSIIGCLDRPDRGSLLFNKDDVSKWTYNKLSVLRRKYIGHVYEKNNLLCNRKSWEV